MSPVRCDDTLRIEVIDPYALLSALLPPLLMAAANALALPLLIEMIVRRKSSVGEGSWFSHERDSYLYLTETAHFQSAESKLNQALVRISSYYPILRFCSALTNRS
jgi:hypothetical protein